MLTLVSLIAGLSLRDGFSGDQALFLTYSKAISNGAILYRDVWDIKQPAIFVFYLTAGKLFGFTEIGVHLLELLYWLSFGVILTAGLKKYFINPFFALLTPLFTIGIYYAVSGSLHFTQAESLVCFPLFMALWLCLKFLENPANKSYLFLSGLFGGIVLTFKLMFIAILFPIWMWVFVCYCFLFHKTAAKRMIILTGMIVSGLMIPIVLVLLYFSQNNSFGDLWYVTFVYPYNAVITITEMAADRTMVLKNGLEWFFKSYFPVIALTAVFIFLNLKSIVYGGRYRKLIFRRENFLFAGLLIWLFAGFAVILIQRLSWWEYHYSLLMVPLGILAVKGIEQCFEKVKSSRHISRKTFAYVLMTAILTLLFIPVARRLVHKIRQSNQVETIKIGSREFGVTGDAADDYKSISADTSFLKKEGSKAAIFVVSNPLYYYLSDSSPIFASNGAMSDMFTDSEWRRLDREMSEKLPDYIFIETRFIQPIKKADPTFSDTVNRNYSIFSTGERGAFYKLNR